MAQHDTGLGWTLKDSYSHPASGILGVFRSPSQLNNDFPLVVSSGYPNETAFISGGKYFLMDTAQVYGIIFGSSGTWPVRARNCFIYQSGTTVYACFVATSSFTINQYNSAFRDVTNHSSISNSTVHNASSSYDSASGLYYWSAQIKTNYTGTLSGGTIPVYSDRQQGLNDMAGTVYNVYKLNSGEALACIAKFHDINGVTRVSPVIISTNADYCVLSLDNINQASELLRISALYQGVWFTMGYFPTWEGMTVTTSYVEIADITNFPALLPKGILTAIAQPDWGNIQVPISPDPYEQEDGESEEDGGNGEEIQDDDVDFTPPPSSMAVSSGFITLFCPTQYELNQLADYMWSPLFDIDTFKKLFANPMDCILGLAVYPFPLVASGTKVVSVGGIATNVSMGYTLQQYWPVDCGSVYVPKQWGAYMDYAPYTKFNIFLPYIGFRPVSADDIMGKTISLRYMVDILSGACNAELKCGNSVLYSWAGSCAGQIPITGNDWRSAITAGVSIAGSIAATVLTQGASAPMIAGTVASATVNSAQLKPEVQRSGSISGNSGFLAGQKPYLVRTNPRSAIPANQNRYSGYPSFITILLGSLTGYNEVYSVHLENIPATGAELEEIESILKGGAIF